MLGDCVSDHDCVSDNAVWALEEELRLSIYALFLNIRITHSETLKTISIRYSGDVYSFQCGMQLLIWGEK